MKQLLVFTCVVALAFASVGFAKEKKDRVKPATVTGTVTKIEAVPGNDDARTLTVTYKANGEEKTLALSVDASTKVLVETGETEAVQTKNGEKQKPKTKDGTVADLQADQRVKVSYSADNTASEILAKAAKVRNKAGVRKNKGGAL